MLGKHRHRIQPISNEFLKMFVRVQRGPQHWGFWCKHKRIVCWHTAAWRSMTWLLYLTPCFTPWSFGSTNWKRCLCQRYIFQDLVSQAGRGSTCLTKHQSNHWKWGGGGGTLNYNYLFYPPVWLLKIETSWQDEGPKGEKLRVGMCLPVICWLDLHQSALS